MTGANMPPEIKVRLNITDFDGDPSEISDILNLAPTKTWLKGERVIPQAINKHKQNGWRISVNSTSLNEGVDNIIRMFSESSDNIGRLPDGTDIEISCVVFFYDTMPYLGFTSKQISFLCAINASVDFDIYDMTGTDSED